MVHRKKKLQKREMRKWRYSGLLGNMVGCARGSGGMLDKRERSETSRSTSVKAWGWDEGEDI